MAKKKIRLIARLDVKDTNLVKGIQLEGLRKLGDPNLFAREYYEQGIALLCIYAAFCAVQFSI